MNAPICDVCREPKPGEGDLDGVMQRIGFVCLQNTDRDPMVCNDCLPFDQPTEWEKEDDAKRRAS